MQIVMRLSSRRMMAVGCILNRGSPDGNSGNVAIGLRQRRSLDPLPRQ
jgi:hypothetical protein